MGTFSNAGQRTEFVSNTWEKLSQFRETYEGKEG